MAKKPSPVENMVSYNNLKSYYAGKKVFITGHTGFKGAWLACFLHLLGAEVKGYALDPEYDNCVFNLIAPLNIIHDTRGDIRNRELTLTELVSFDPDFVFHLAAQPLVRRSYRIPAETFDVNVTGTANLLEAVKAVEKKCTAVIITTDKVYENKENGLLYNEEDGLGGHDPYSASKACAEIVASSFRSSFFNPENFDVHQKALATARAGNVIGGGDWNEDRLMPDIIKSLTAGKAIKIRNPASIRPWQHVLEPLAGYLLLGGLLDGDHARFSQAYNFGPYPGDHITVGQFVQLVVENWGRGEWYSDDALHAPHESKVLKLDISKAKRELNWQPKLTAETAIRWTADWYKCEKEGQTAYIFQQINEYLSL